MSHCSPFSAALVRAGRTVLSLRSMMCRCRNVARCRSLPWGVECNEEQHLEAPDAASGCELRGLLRGISAALLFLFLWYTSLSYVTGACCGQVWFGLVGLGLKGGDRDGGEQLADLPYVGTRSCLCYAVLIT
jgi:hypothetical protein